VEKPGLLSLMVPPEIFLVLVVLFGGNLAVNGLNFVDPEEGVILIESLDTGASPSFLG